MLTNSHKHQINVLSNLADDHLYKASALVDIALMCENIPSLKSFFLTQAEDENRLGTAYTNEAISVYENAASGRYVCKNKIIFGE